MEDIFLKKNYVDILYELKIEMKKKLKILCNLYCM